MNIKTMIVTRRIVAALLLGTATVLPAQAQEVVVIGHPGLPATDRAALMRLYTGRAIELAGTPVKVVNAPPGSATRASFLKNVVHMDEAGYRAYWTVRRHVGKGVPPADVAADAAMIEFVTRTPGAIGYISAESVTDGLNVVARF
jgi:ABC-type phosphate transport system substrate-binding protein